MSENLYENLYVLSGEQQINLFLNITKIMHNILHPSEVYIEDNYANYQCDFRLRP